MKAAGRLGRDLRDARAVEPLLRALADDESGDVRAFAADALFLLGDARALEPLLRALACDEHFLVRRFVAERLGSPILDPARLGDSRAVEPLSIALVEDKDPSVRRAAAEALARLGDSRAVEPLSTALTDRATDVREAAAQALGQLGDPRAAEPLRAAQDREPRGGHTWNAVTASLRMLEGAATKVAEPTTWTPVNPRLASNRPLSALEHVFIFTTWDAERWLNSPASAIVWGTLQDTASAPREQIVGKVGMEVIGGSDAGPETNRSGQVPDVVQLTVSSMRPELADDHLCVRTYNDPQTGEEGLVVLVYKEPSGEDVAADEALTASFGDLIAAFDKAHDDPLRQAELIQRAARMAQGEADASRKQLMEFEVATRYQGLKERTGYPGP